MYRQVLVNSFASSASFVGRGPSSRQDARRARRAVRRRGGIRADDLGQRAELLEGMALGDPLRAERDIDLAATAREVLRHICRRARVDGAPKDDERSIAQVRCDLIDRLLEHGHGRTEEFVDRGPDDDHEIGCSLDHRAVGAEGQSSGRRQTSEQLRSSRLHEGHLAGSDAIKSVG